MCLDDLIEKKHKIKKLDQKKYDKYKDQYPLSAKYDLEWVLNNEMGPNALWMCEWTCEKMELKPCMRVLDMGCGKAMTSIFLAKEYGVTVWANDLWVKASNNWKRICEAGLENKVFPIHAEAHALPYAEGFFDAIICIDSYQYYGTDDLYLKYFSSFLKKDGQIGLGLVGMRKDFEQGVPDYLKDFWEPAECGSFHTIDWWKKHFIRTELVDVEHAEVLDDNLLSWIEFEEIKHTAGTVRFPNELPALSDDKGQYLALMRMIARKK